MADLGLSTSWNAKGEKSGRQIIDEIKAAGFDSVELNFTLSQKTVDEIAVAVAEGRIKVRSAHNFCPVPDEIPAGRATPDYFSLASLDEEERRKAVFYTKRTIIEAVALGAKAVVLHCGRVNAQDQTRRLIDLYNEQKSASDEFLSIREGMFSSRKALIGQHLNSVLKSLDELSGFAVEKDIMLGIENRFYFMEIPQADEIAVILEKFKGTTIRYWHDVGHAQVFDVLGFARHKDLLERFGAYCGGIHLHDVRGAQDHLAPGRGSFDFSILKRYTGADCIRIIEAHAPATIDDLKNAREYLNKVFS